MSFGAFLGNVCKENHVKYYMLMEREVTFCTLLSKQAKAQERYQGWTERRS